MGLQILKNFKNPLLIFLWIVLSLFFINTYLILSKVIALMVNIDNVILMASPNRFPIALYGIQTNLMFFLVLGLVLIFGFVFVGIDYL